MKDKDTSKPNDDLKWFGEGFDGFPKRLPDDCAEYACYVLDETTADIRIKLNQILKASEALKKQLLEHYIWQRDDFELKVYPDIAAPSATTALPTSKQKTLRPHLRGRTNFGDSVADEWLVVYLIYELSKQFPDAWFQVQDTDGEFLLIEAANSLPKWLNPDIAENRVWISNGHLRLIPLEDNVAHQSLSRQEALDKIREDPEKLVISPFIEDEAFYRIREYPAAVATTIHRAIITVPRRLAHLLHQRPACISPAVEAFYLRDSVSLKPLATKDISTLHFPPEDFVTVSTSFTKIGYSQLRSQLFDPPPAWTGIIPRLRDAKVELGMKLTCGFEMLLSDKQNQDQRAVREVKLLLQDIDSGEDALPSDADLQSWPQTQDDEKWLDIDYNDFENELSGRKGTAPTKDGSSGFGDRGAQQNLRKMVSRFEDFLNDDTSTLR